MGGVSRPIYSIDDIPGVDATSPQINQVLKWTGSAWVPAAYNDTFQLSIASFTAVPANGTILLMGTPGNTAIAAGNVAFTAAYSNNTPTSGSIALTSDGGLSWANPLTLLTPFTSGISEYVINYPSGPSTYARFTLTASDGNTTPTATITYWFGNSVYWGYSTKNENFVANDILNMLGGGDTALTAHSTTSRQITGMKTPGRYVTYAYPNRFVDLISGWECWVQGTHYGITGFYPVPMNEEVVTGVTNVNGYSEDYRVHATQEDLIDAYPADTILLSAGNGRSYAFPSLMFWGTTQYAGDPNTNYSYTSEELQEESRGGTLISYSGATMDGNWNVARQFSLTVGANEYVVIAIPGSAINAYTDMQFWVNGVQGGFLYCGTRNVRSPYGFIYGGMFEPHYIFRSLNHSLGQTTIVTTVTG